MDEARSAVGSAPDPVKAAKEGDSVREARADELPRMVEALARAFYDDPVMCWLFPGEERRLDRLERLFGYFGRKVWFPHELTYTTEDVVGGAIWVPPGEWRVSILEQLRMMPGLISSVGPRDLPRALRGFNIMESRHPDDEHYYLPVVGVDPSWQGKGIGTALLGPVLERCDREGADAYLEATSDRSRACYERSGFRVVDEFRFPKGPMLWAMRREPPTGDAGAA